MKNILKLILTLVLVGSINSCSSSTSKVVGSEIDKEVSESVSDELLQDSGDEFAQDDFSQDDFAEEDTGFDDFASEDGPVADSAEPKAQEEIAQNDVDLFSEDFDELGAGDTANDEEELSIDDLADGDIESFDQAEAPSDLVKEDIPVSIENNSNQGTSVTGLDFLANQNGGTIMISTSEKVEFSQRKNLSTGQYIVELKNVKLPKKFQRPYDTREFDGSVGMFQAYQEENGNTARFVVQLNGDAEPLITQEGNSLLIVTSNNEVLASRNTQPTIPQFDSVVDEEAIKRDKTMLSQRTLEDFISGNNKYYGKRINIELMDTEIVRVFDIIAEQSGLNIIVSEDVKGKITLKLRDIPWDQAMMVVLQTKQLGYVKNGNILRILPLKKIEDESNEARRVIEAQRMLQPLRVRIFPISFAKSENILLQVNEFLTPERGKAKSDTRTNTIIVRDIPEVLNKISKLISELDTETPQVLMEAKFVEATETFEKEINLNMGAAIDSVSTNHKFTGVGGSSESGFDFSLLNVGRWGSVTAFLNLYQKKNLAKIISSPRVIGLNNESASIKQTTQILDRTIALDAETNTTTTSFIPRDVNLSLEITPQITAEGSVLMDINVQRDVPGAEEVSDDGGVTARPIGKRSAKTKVLVPNGDTVVIGGIYQYDRSNIETKMPLLGDIPILGWLFKKQGEEYQKNELMIFVTPRVLNIEKAFGKGERYLEEDSIFGQEDATEKPTDSL